MADEMKPVNQRVLLASVRAHPRNYNAHPQAQVERIAASLRKFGQVRSIVVWRSVILAGHGVVEAARSLGWREIAADVLPDDYPEHLALAYVAADNELARLGEPDAAQLAAILEESAAADAELLLAMGYTDAEYTAMLETLTPASVSEWGAALGRIPSEDRSPFQQMTFTLHDEQAETVRKAIALAGKVGDFSDSPNQNSNGNALAFICEVFVDNHGQG